MFNFFYETVFPSLGYIFAILAEVATLPTAYFGMLVIGENLPMVLNNVFTGEEISFTIYSYFEIVREIELWGYPIIADFVEVLFGLTADICGTIYNIFWSPFTHMPMFVGLPIGGLFFGLVFPLFIRVVSWCLSLIGYFIDMFLPT